MTRTARTLPVLFILGLALPALAQGPATGPGTGPGAPQVGPQGSAARTIAPQLQAIQEALLNADQQLSQAQTGNQRPNYPQALVAVRGAQNTLAEMRSAAGGRDNPLIGDAERELATTRQLLETPGSELPQVVTQLRAAASAVTAIGSATGATTGGTAAPGQPALGGGPRQ